MSQLAVKPALKRPRAQRYLSTTAMAATASTMALVSQVLGFEIIEVWTEEADGKLHCTYVHVDDEILEQYPDIIHGHFPKHTKEHVVSPMVSHSHPYFSFPRVYDSFVLIPSFVVWLKSQRITIIGV